MIRFLPEPDSASGRILSRLAKLLGLRSETVYSRAILVLTLLFMGLGLLVLSGVGYALFYQMDLAGRTETAVSALEVRSFIASAIHENGGTTPRANLLAQCGQLTGKEISFAAATPALDEYWRKSPEKVVLEKLPGGRFKASTPLRGSDGALLGVIRLIDKKPYYQNGLVVLRVFLVGLAIAGGIGVLLMVITIDGTILRRIKLLADKVENEKNSHRLPVRLNFSGDDELAVLAQSMEELARLVQAAERQYRSVVEDQTESICRFDAGRHITFSNRAFDALCDVPPIGPSPDIAACLEPGTSALLEQKLRGLSASDPIVTFTHEIQRSGKEAVWYRSILRGNFDEHGNFIGGQWIASDVTTEIVAQRKLQQSRQELEILSGRLMHLQDLERRRIARDLHDSTSQNLSAIEINIGLLKSLVDNGRASKVVEETQQIVHQVSRELRNISYLLHPPLLEEQGLLFAIRWFADGYTRRNGLPVVLDFPENFERLGNQTETALFRVVQEAMSNIYRHAHATKVWITLREEDDGSLFLEIRDNGEGLPGGFAFGQSTGVGLAGMRERMKQLGGSLDVSSTPYGVSVICRLKRAVTDVVQE